MNSFVNTLLSVMLGWIRTLISNIWTMLASEDGGALFQFLSAYWLVIVILLCAGGVLADLIIYFFRWRPDYVWLTRWRRLTHGKRRAEPENTQNIPEQAMQPAYEPAAHAFEPENTYAPAMHFSETWQPAAGEPDPLPDDVQFWETEEDLDMDWSVSEEVPAFGAPQPEPLTYFRDVQAGFAPPVPPEQLYAPPAEPQSPAWPVSEGVHPGLDAETFRQNLGLDEAPASEGAPVVRAPAFQPFTVTHAPEEAAPSTALQRIAQKARSFIAMDENEKTIRDLHSSVDVSKAFHKPVYPQSFDHTEE